MHRAAAFLLLCAPAAFAQALSPCHADAERFCPGQTARGGKLGLCLQAHAAELSKDCRALVDSMLEEMAEIRDACARDERSYCADVTPGQGRMRTCLGEHALLLSNGCHEALSKLRSPDACAQDAQKLCKDIPPGDSRILGCLKEHEAQLSEPCRKQTELLKSTLDELDKACDHDAETVCKDVKPGHGAVIACLQQHAPQLSPACRKLLQR